MTELDDPIFITSPQALGVELWYWLERYRVTQHGENRWTMAAIRNVVRIAHHIEDALSAVGGTINSCYRSPTINAAVGGSRHSRHLDGLAADIRPGPKHTPHTAATLLWHLANNGKLGLVEEVIEEPTWVHVGWLRVGEVGRPELLRSDGKSTVRLA